MDLPAAKTLALTLMAQHGLNGWRFAFDQAKRRMGSCHYGKRQISLSRHLTLLNDEATVRDTILHEIAHALTPGAKHGPAWRAVCQQIGARPSATVESHEVNIPAPTYYLVCSHCGTKIPRYRRSRRRLVCRSCFDAYRAGRGPRPEPLAQVRA